MSSGGELGPIHAAVGALIDLLARAGRPSVIGVEKIHSRQAGQPLELAPAATGFFGAPNTFGCDHPTQAIVQKEQRYAGLLQRDQRPVRAAIARDRRHGLDAAALDDGADGDAAPGGRELQVGDGEGGALFVVEVLQPPARGVLGMQSANQTEQGSRQAHATAWEERDRKTGPAPRDWPRPRR